MPIYYANLGLRAKFRVLDEISDGGVHGDRRIGGGGGGAEGGWMELEKCMMEEKRRARYSKGIDSFPLCQGLPLVDCCPFLFLTLRINLAP